MLVNVCRCWCAQHLFCDAQAYLPESMPVISVSKGLEMSSGHVLSDIIPLVLGRKHPTIYLSGPSFAAELMEAKPTGVVAASKVE